MTTDRDLERLLDQWLADGPNEVSDRVIEQIADRIERQSQRPAWRLRWKDAQMKSPARVAAALAAVLVLAVGAYAVIQRPASGIGGPGSTPSPTPAATGTAVLHATSFDIPLSLTPVDGWHTSVVDNGVVDLLRGGVDLGIHSIALVTLPGPTLADPWVPVPADFVAWIAQRPEYVPSAPRTVTIAGRSGTLIDAEFVWKDGTAPRDLVRYGTGAWRYDSLDAGARIRFVILPGASGVGGIMIVMNAKDAEFEAAATSLDLLLATLQFDPAPSPSG